MEKIIALGILITATLTSFWIALLLYWLCLEALFRLLAGRVVRPGQ